MNKMLDVPQQTQQADHRALDPQLKHLRRTNTKLRDRLHEVEKWSFASKLIATLAVAFMGGTIWFAINISRELQEIKDNTGGIRIQTEALSKSAEESKSRDAKLDTDLAVVMTKVDILLRKRDDASRDSRQRQGTKPVSNQLPATAVGPHTSLANNSTPHPPD